MSNQLVVSTVLFKRDHRSRFTSLLHASRLIERSCQGSIYQRIISDVIESSQVDFEEGGVDPSTLEELRQVGVQLFLLSYCIVILFCSRRCQRRYRSWST